MILKAIKYVASKLPYREIVRENGDIYLTRYALFGFMPNRSLESKFPISLYLHHFHRPDADDAPHNHPWKWSCSFVLSGGYIEFRANEDPETSYCKGWTRRIKPFRFNWISHSCYHLVKELKGKETWTLFLAGPRISSWGFLDFERGHIEWRQYLTEKGLKLPY